MLARRHRAIALACCAGAGAAILLAGPLTRSASSQEAPGSGETAAANPMAGDGMWIWYLSKAQGGNVNRIAKRARNRGIEYVLIKAGDAGRTWSQFSPGSGEGPPRSWAQGVRLAVRLRRQPQG